MWMVRNPGGQHTQELLDRGIVGIGWPDIIPDIKNAKSPHEFYKVVKDTYPDLQAQGVVNAGRQLFKFFREMKKGDEVLTYDSPSRTYHVGEIIGDVQSDPNVEHLSNTRSANWLYKVDRDKLSQAARDSLGSTLTIFKPSAEAVKEIQRAIVSPSSLNEEIPIADTEAENPLDNARTNSHELIKDRITKLSWKDMQELVAGILRAMGYKTRVSPEGADRGKDITASPDGLGFTQPRSLLICQYGRIYSRSEVRGRTLDRSSDSYGQRRSRKLARRALRKFRP